MHQFSLHILIYLAEVSVCLAALALFYLIIARKNTFHLLNRYVLLAIVFCSFSLPLLHVELPGEAKNRLSYLSAASEYPDVTIPQSPEVKTENSKTENFLQNEGTSKPDSQAVNLSHWSSFLLILMLSVTGLLLIRLIISTLKVLRVRKNAEYLFNKGHYVINHVAQPFSFFRWIFIPRKLVDQNNYKTILDHESIHSRSLHSFDVMLFEVLKALLWFNPFVYILSKKSRLVNEYYTDRIIATKNSADDYADVLISYSKLQPINYSLKLANNFALLSLKTRIMQLFRKPTTGYARLSYFSFLPVFLMLFLLFSCDQNEDIDRSSKIRSIKAYFHDEYGDQSERNGSLIIDKDFSENPLPLSVMNENPLRQQLSFIQWGPEIDVIKFGKSWPEVRESWSELTADRLVKKMNETTVYAVDKNGSRTFNKTAKILKSTTPEGFETVRIESYDDEGKTMSSMTFDNGQLYEYDDHGRIITLKINRVVPHTENLYAEVGSHNDGYPLFRYSVDRYDLVYDVSGNLTRSNLNGKINKTFKYDDDNRLIEITVLRKDRMARFFKIKYDGPDEFSKVEAYNAAEEIEYSLNYEYEYY